MGLRRFFLRRKEDADLARELDAHIMHQVDENLAAGMSPDEARRQAYLKLGSPRRVREDVWEWNTLGLAEDVVRNVRHGIRLFWQKPGFAAVSVLTLALGIRATTAIFSAVNPMLFESLPYPRARRPRAVVLSRFCFGISRLDRYLCGRNTFIAGRCNAGLPGPGVARGAG
ncbi:MAG TPA: permease prefix domain 1-containing protein [Candidatus Angelobacter sp.]|nr:permease prefix domain 1-containing protein [Candidatus Angelobacter sp.]